MDTRHGGHEASSTNDANQPLADLRRTQDSAQNSAPNEPSAVEDHAPSKATSKTSSTRNSTPAATSRDFRQSSQASHDAAADREAMQDAQDTASSSSNQAPLSKESEENGAAPYGTRSRNRPGRSRPNYAEDTEMDFETTAAPANGNISDPPSRDSVATESGQSSGVGGKKGPGPASGNVSWGNAGPNPKDNPATPNIPGASASTAATNQASTAQPATKRRKNAAATNGTHASAPAPSQAGTKRGSQVLPAASSARESNMMTFERTGAMLKNGHMEADDGQIVSINGKF
jgi:hypothetical protein